MVAAQPATITTPRILRLRDVADQRMLGADGKRALRFVFDAEEFLSKEELRIASYRETIGQPMIVRRAKAFHHICSEWDTPIDGGELILGSQRGNIWWRGSADPTTAAQRERYEAIQESCRELGIAFGEGHVVCDYPRIINEGLKTQAARIDLLRDCAPADDPRALTWDAMAITCDGARIFAERYAQAAREMAESAEPARRDELLRIAEVCARVPWQPARTLTEAVQSFWFAHLLLHVESPSVAISPGRMDQYLCPFYASDIAAGRCSHDEAAELLACLWLKFFEGDESQNLVVGGIDAGGFDATNDLSYLMVQLTDELHAFQPSLSVRMHRDTPAEFWQAATRLSAEGTGQPSFFNDEIVRASLHSIGVPESESWDWAIVGCYEAVVAGCEWARTVAGGTSLPHCVLGALGERPESFEALQASTLERLKSGIDEAVEAANAHEEYEAKWAPSPFQSVMMRDCIQQGIDIYSGGARYNYSACWPGCLATGVDSLVAIKRVVYEDQAVTLEALLDALDRDFANSEDLRQMLVRRAPKFGNDIDAVDELAREISEFFCAEVVKRRNPRGGTFQPALAMYQVHYRGLETGATPDGRHASTPFSAGVAPTQGYNERGVTATLASCAKLPHHLGPDGNFLIISMPPDSVAGADGINRLMKLIRTYFEQGGSHVMVNVVDAETLRDAQDHPEKHRDLMVRISGLSAYFVTLPSHLQDDIIQRTSQGL